MSNSNLEQLPQLVQSRVNEGGTRDEILLDICKLINQKLDAYDWVGFYIVDPTQERMLKLGPYVGDETDHIYIPFGKGICGQAAETLETFVIDDVNKESNYLSCSINVKSEIVVPVFKNGEFIAELDIDSHKIAAFGKKDQEIMEEICRIIEPVF